MTHPERRPEGTPRVRPRAPLSVPPAAFPIESPLRGPAHPPRTFEDVVAGVGAKSGSAAKSVGGAYSFVAGLSHLTIDHASLSRRSTVPTPSRDTSNIRALVTFIPYIT